jgi:NSS family neurotransmitter:Na+ symporter
MSNLFANIPFGHFFGGMFFLLVFFAAISSAIGYLEPIVMTCCELFKMSRIWSVTVSLLAIFIVGFPNILAHGVWSHILVGGRNLFDLSDYISGNIMMPLGALVLAFYTLFIWKFDHYQKDTNVGANWFRVFRWWAPAVKYFIPATLLLIFITGII